MLQRYKNVQNTLKSKKCAIVVYVQTNKWWGWMIQQLTKLKDYGSNNIKIIDLTVTVNAQINY